MPISAIIIARDEAENIGACLDTLVFCDERIVVDGGSVDATMSIATAKGARVVAHEWKGFGPQKNFALSLARQDWVLSIDADERVGPDLAREIQGAAASGLCDGYEIRRISSFLG